jgi:predicted Fe-S protein YdhL (DUF1289 family)
MTSTMYTFADELFSDMHKDAFGFRPSADSSQNWKNMSDDDKQLVWDNMQCIIEEDIKVEQRERECEVTKFKESLVKVTAIAGSEIKALRWLTEEENFENDQDIEHWLYMSGLLYTDYGRKLREDLGALYGIPVPNF